MDIELFKCLKQKYGEHYEAFMLSKLVPVAGNVGDSNLGMKEELAIEIAKDVQIIVNSAGDTAFHQRLRSLLPWKLVISPAKSIVKNKFIF